MNDQFDFDDPAFAGRVGAWADARRRDDQAPERLVRSVLDGVATTPRRRSSWPWHLPRAMTDAVALAAIVVISVTVGILLARGFEGQVGRPSIPPVPVTTASPSSSRSELASPAALVRLEDLPVGAAAIAAGDDSVWIATRDGVLEERDPADGTVRRSVQLPRVPAALLVTDDDVWAASPDGPVVRVSRATLEPREIPGAAGSVLVADGDRVWLGGDQGVSRIDAASGEVTLREPVSARSDRLGIAVDPSGVWVATLARIERRDPETGAVTATIPGDATGIVALDGRILAKRGTELLVIDPTTATILDYLPGFPPGTPIVIAGSRIWTAGPPGGAVGQLVAFDPGLDRIVAEATVSMPVSGLAVTADSVWLISDEQDTIARFVLP